MSLAQYHVEQFTPLGREIPNVGQPSAFVVPVRPVLEPAALHAFESVCAIGDRVDSRAGFDDGFHCDEMMIVG